MLSRLPPSLRTPVLAIGFSALGIGSFAYLNEYRPVEGVVNRIVKSAIPPDEKLRNTSSADLVRTWIVFSACQFPWLVENSPKILSTLKSIPLVSILTESIVRQTFFDQFVGGDTAAECLPIVRKLRHQNVGTLFAYSVEATEEEVASASAASGEGAYELRRRGAQERVKETIKAIEISGEENRRFAAEQPGGAKEGEVGSTWVAVKASGLISDPSILQRASNTILAIRAQNPSKSSYVYYPGTPTTKELALLSQPSTAVALPPLLDGVTPADLVELRLLYTDLRKVMESARQGGVRIIMDAEYSWYQPSIDAFTTLLSQEFNKTPQKSSKTPSYPPVQPLIYGTYQAYLRRNVAHMIESLAHAKLDGYSLGIKMVRGAYHDQELARWDDKSSSTTFRAPLRAAPVWQTKPETDACYDAGIDILLDALLEDVKTSGKKGGLPRVGVIFATHNPESVRKVVGGMVRRKLATSRVKDEDWLRVAEVLDVGSEVRKRVIMGQLYGMCDTLTNATSATFSPNGSPLVLKYVPYGALSEVLPYLGRRAIENKTVMAGEGGAKAETERAKKELTRRWFGWEHYV